MAILISHLILGFSLIGLVKSLDSSVGPDSVCGYINGGHAVSYPYWATAIDMSGVVMAQIVPFRPTDDSLPACATYTWPGFGAEGYFCAPSRTTITVIAEKTAGDETTSAIEPSDATTAPLPEPTDGGETDYSTADGHPQPTLDGGPNLGTEHDLSSQQRIGAGVGSGVSGGLLLLFFAIFGCLSNIHVVWVHKS
ncbi:hypothetical protein FGSG_10786 [Fusarium graminearum PH-1]|uniref:hypothetical protein n=1 Tax=Gibberella zeae (strain ATCC MYA-4620 / CBS 123657 / FGSC 9075 / NRRL 31084 / PH-1) TaxID=229533 RepID=UPI000023E37B|nr:hypothetical protein FGSG_10786 [Fusarium graminearum PH-1]ESU17994.1 hypothetical protein FGSG_10786 [Fusarium graminearum PH-1]EYB34049.1 hypothetical protein FG05_10786 [Fusarium graminearum]|eukprot:XP_011325616.1 hypothetical protein FGSG_10786 [Fusarium graminearum PH-1]